MRLGAAAAALCCLVSCAPGGATAAPTPPPVVPAAASVDAVTPYHGSYRTSDGGIVVIARLGWFFDMGDGSYRTLYAGGAPNRFTIGYRYLEPLPRFAELVFTQDKLTITETHRTRIAQLVAYTDADVSIPAAGAVLAGHITKPLGAGAHPGVVVVHGAERGLRYYYDVWVGIYASLGLAVLTYDKRGSGASTGRYPGESPTSEALTIYADDASAALGFLAHQPGLDPRRVGFYAGSQGGWTVPLAIQRHGVAAFDVLASAPATTVDQTDLWKGFSNGGETMPIESTAQMLTAVRATHSGYDPGAALQQLAVPTLWLLGSNDRTVPTAVCVEILSAMQKPNFTVQLVQSGHGLLLNPTGLLADDARAPGFAPGLLPVLQRWIEAHVTPGASA